VQQPSFAFSGLEETTDTCLFPPCRHVSRRQRTLPRLQRSSSGVIIGGGLGGFGGGFGGDGGSSGGGGYDGGAVGGWGGGDSGGGGASGGW